MMGRWILDAKRALEVVLVAALCLTVVPAAAASTESGEDALVSEDKTESSAEMDYYSFYNSHLETPHASSVVELTQAQWSSAENESAQWKDYAGRTGIAIGEENAWAEWVFEVEEAGLYNLQLDYYPLTGSGQDIELAILLDGNQPFAESGALTVPRIWVDKTDESGTAIHQDASGNDMKPEQIENPRWAEAWLTDELGMYEEPYFYYLEAGEHTLRLQVNRENMAVSGIKLGVQDSLVSYEEYAQTHAQETVQGQLFKLEAEAAFEKNSSMLAPSYDSANAGMSPASDPQHVRLTMIGATEWYQTGQALSWKVPDDLPAGLYNIALRVNQRSNPGTSTYRRLYINGEVPFEQVNSIEFPYASEWYVKTLGDDDPFLFYLEPGDVLTLEATTGATAGLLRGVNRTVLDLNALYRQIITITGAEPDAYRDYSLEKEIPGLMDSLNKLRVQVESLSVNIKELMGKPNSQTAILDQLVLTIDSFLSQPNSIPENLGAFKSGIDGTASIILNYNEQPLSLDVIYLKSPDVEEPQANPGFWDNLVYGFKRLWYSFAGDYDNIRQSGAYDKTITVWAMTGRDQAQILSRLVSDQFSSQSGIGVQLNLISSETTLIQSLLADRGPDVTVMLKQDTPINLALRGAAVDLSDPKYGLSQEFKEEFWESAWTPFTYRGGIYAMPETQDFNVMFYRSDILEELGISVPQTWDEFYDVVKILQNKNYVVGIQEVSSTEPGVSASISTFDTFLFQNGGRYFNDDMTATVFDTTEAYDAFDQWVGLYKSYGFERSFEFSNLMRTGEMPLGIAPYGSTYTKIAATAPELKGLWSIAMIPGVRQEDGTINRATSSTATGCVMHHTAVNRGVDMEAFRFMTWWTGEEAQTSYAQSVEAAMGVAGRVAVANKGAFEQLGWTTAERQVLQGQAEWVQGIPQVPGNYILNRSLTNALRRSVDEMEENRRMLTIYNQFINEELERKRQEFER